MCTDGYKGRTGLYQVMPVSEEIQRLVIPPEPRLLADDCTMEKLGVLMAEQDGRLKPGETVIEGRAGDSLATAKTAHASLPPVPPAEITVVWFTAAPVEPYHAVDPATAPE